MTDTDPVDVIVTAVVRAINEGVAETNATAPDYLALDDTDTDLHVAVFPRADLCESWFTDETDRSDIQIAVLIRQKLVPYDPERVAWLKRYAREIRDCLRNAHPLERLGDHDISLWQIEHNPLWSPELLRTQQTFASILLITYRTEYDCEA